ncbi:phosphotransferase family protein [Terrabacter sp. 2RAF25]|uniref:phosphotransferase family protein n=1 Tax=Terrabacter sp. 2RAF25 TaxID=3232998 RepID=UPI003F952B98
MTTALVEGRAADLLRTTLREHVGPGPRRLLVVGLSRDDHPKATVLVFRPTDALPALALKVAMVPGAVPAVLAEAAALTAAAQLGPDLVGGTVPRVLDCRHAPDSAVLVTSVVPGVPMAVDYHRWRHTARPTTVRGDLDAAVSWLEQLARVPVPDRATSAPTDRVPTDPAAVAALVAARWPGDAEARTVEATVRGLSRELALPPGLPRTMVHGDFWCGNVLRTGGRVTGVVDWEHAQVAGDALRDVTRFVLAYLLYLDRHTDPGRPVSGHPGLVAGPWGEPVRFAASGAGWLSELVQAVVAGHLRRTGRDPGRWREALGIAAAEVAAVADEPAFARRHLALAAELLRCC